MYLALKSRFLPVNSKSKEFPSLSLLFACACVHTHSVFNQTGHSWRICCWTLRNTLSCISVAIATDIIMPCEYYWSWLWQISHLIFGIAPSTEEAVLYCTGTAPAVSKELCWTLFSTQHLDVVRSWAWANLHPFRLESHHFQGSWRYHSYWETIHVMAACRYCPWGSKFHWTANSVQFFCPKLPSFACYLSTVQSDKLLNVSSSTSTPFSKAKSLHQIKFNQQENSTILWPY